MSIAALTCAVVDCADPKALAACYLKVLDADVLSGHPFCITASW